MLRSALDFPTAGDHGARSVLVGGGLLLLAAVAGVLGALFPPLLGGSVLALLVVRGYHFRVLRAAAGGQREPPRFERWADLVVDGLRATLVHALYLLPALVLGGVALAGNLSVGLLTRPGAALSAVQGATGFAVLFLLLYLLVALYVMPAAVTLAAYEGRMGAALEVRRVLSGAASEDYAVGWMVAGLLQLLAFPIAVLLQTVLVGFLLQFLVAVAARFVYARGFADALDLPPLSEPSPRPEAHIEAVPEPVTPAIRPVEPSETDALEPIPAVRRVGADSPDDDSHADDHDVDDPQAEEFSR